MPSRASAALSSSLGPEGWAEQTWEWCTCGLNIMGLSQGMGAGAAAAGGGDDTAGSGDTAAATSTSPPSTVARTFVSTGAARAAAVLASACRETVAGVRDQRGLAKHCVASRGMLFNRKGTTRSHLGVV